MLKVAKIKIIMQKYCYYNPQNFRQQLQSLMTFLGYT